MAIFRRLGLAILACAAAPLLQGVSQLDEPTYGDNVYVNCAWRVAAIFPAPPMTRDFTYALGGESAPARQFYVRNGEDLYSVIVANFANGPAVDENLVESAAVPLRQQGEVRFQSSAVYDPGIPGRQLDIFAPNGRQRRASVYMADHRLYITETDTAPGEFAALQFEQSVSLINERGTDLDKNVGQNSRQYHCTNG
jgi:hypothetical protein